MKSENSTKNNLTNFGVDNYYLSDHIFKSIVHFTPDDIYFRDRKNYQKSIFYDLKKKGIGKLEGNNWSIRSTYDNLTEKEWNIIPIRTQGEGRLPREGTSIQLGEYGVLVINTEKNNGYYVSYNWDKKNEWDQIKEKTYILTKYNTNIENIKLLEPTIQLVKSGFTYTSASNKPLNTDWSHFYTLFFIEWFIEQLEKNEKINDDITLLPYDHCKRCWNDLKNSGFYQNYIAKKEHSAKHYYLQLLENPLRQGLRNKFHDYRWFDLDANERKEIENYFDQEKSKEKEGKLESSEEISSSEQTKKSQEEISSLIKQLEEAKSELSFLKLTNSLNESKDKETVEITNELSDSNNKLESQKAEKDKLENDITEKEKQKQSLEKEGKTDNEEYKKILAEIEELRKKLASTDREIEKLRRQTANLKEQLNASYLSLQEAIEENKEKLKEVEESCLKNLKENQTLHDIIKSKLGGGDYDEKLKTLLQVQEEITRNNSKFATNEKNKMIESIPEFSEQLKALCILQEQLTQLEMKKEDIEKAGQAFKTVMIAPVIPSWLCKIKNDLSDTCDVEKNINYDEILAKAGEFVLSTKTAKLPTRLYHIKENRIVETENNSNVNNYAILSYVWGQPGNISDEAKNELDSIWSNAGYKNSVNPAGYKSLKKAIEACRLLSIDYLWMDQLCVNQENTPAGLKERSEEVPKMRKYYFNSAMTLIAIHSSLGEEIEGGVDSKKILKKVVRSQWFSRSWTFQEGWLSRQTIFMFDSHLIDGSSLANQWVLDQPSYIGGGYKSILEEGSKKFATPLGWTYYKEGYSDEDRISFSLNQALRAIKKRGRGVSIDGIYSILGLLPYGEEVKVKYKNWGEEYSEKDLQEALIEVIKVAIDNGYGELFSWHGSGNNWLPEIYKEGQGGHLEKIKGGTSIEGGITVIQKGIYSASENKISVFEYVIKDILGESTTRKETKDGGSVIESGACVRNVLLYARDSQKETSVTLLSTNEILKNQVRKEDILLLLSPKEWRSNKPFALIVRKNEGENIYQRIGLVEIREKDQEKLQQIGEETKLMFKIDGSNKNIDLVDQLEQKLELLQKQELQTQVEQPPK
jgi:hypothetical protein